MAKSNMDQDILKVLFSEQEIHDRIQEMGNQLYDEFHDRNPLFVGVLNGCFLFMADLVRATQCKSEVEFIGLSSYQNATKSSGVVQITRDLQRDISGRDIIVVEDILDSGNTLSFLRSYLMAITALLGAGIALQVAVQHGYRVAGADLRAQLHMAVQLRCKG